MTSRPLPASPSSGERARPAASSQAAVRAENLAVVARAVHSSPEPPSRALVAERTALTRSTVSRLVDELVAGGILREAVPAQPVSRGRPGTPLLPGTGLAALGLQVNVAGLGARVIDLTGEVVAERTVVRPLRDAPPRAVLEELASLAEEVLAEVPDGVRVVGARLALPGVVSAEAGELLVAPNLGWRGVVPRDLLGPGALRGLPLRIGNEADLAARAVADDAPGRPGPLRDFVYVSGEIGIGGSVVVDGEVLRGRHGWAGEVGHVCVDPDGPPCPCGSTGCLERYAGREALAEATGVPPEDLPRVLAARVAAGEQRAVAGVRRAAWALGVALAGVVNILDIPAVVLGGHLGQVAPLLRPDLEKHLASRVLSARWVTPTVTSVDEGTAPGATGAAVTELAAVVADPGPWLERTRRAASG